MKIPGFVFVLACLLTGCGTSTVHVAGHLKVIHQLPTNQREKVIVFALPNDTNTGAMETDTVRAWLEQRASIHYEVTRNESEATMIMVCTFGSGVPQQFTTREPNWAIVPGERYKVGSRLAMVGTYEQKRTLRSYFILLGMQRVRDAKIVQGGTVYDGRFICGAESPPSELSAIRFLVDKAFREWPGPRALERDWSDNVPRELQVN